ncbi:Peptidase S53 domain-containing protein [Mycena chlorophos]|uniref:tripeptidyl-peptidase II n=1 Tax=Mycena chlorophos TaxID=658473 RepID=A0A8H6S6S0_MYCCL|nr:Peptidase S53 domain-containing protein [Mycena chlorophos]
MFPRVFFLAALTLNAAAAPSRRAMALRDSRAEPRGFVNTGAAAADTEITLRIQMAHTNMTGLEAVAYDIATPSSANYGKHLTVDELVEFVKPTADTSAAVLEWLSENNIESTVISPAGDTLSITIPVSQANELLDTTFSVFSDLDSGKTIIRTLEYSIPASLHGHINLVYPTLSFVRPQAIPKFTSHKSRREVKRDIEQRMIVHEGRAVPASCTETITPTCLQDIYGIPSAPGTQASNSLAVAGFSEQFANQADLKVFLTSFRPDISPSTTFTLQTLDGGSNPQNRSEAGLEANLDIQYTVGVATGVQTSFISVGRNNADGVDGFLDIINFLINETTRPLVLSTSYGFDEAELPLSDLTSLCNAYMQLGALGTSILFASGDGGVAGSQPQTECTTFRPTAPSGCPFLTSVGATQGFPETAAPFSSGGFSNVFPTPSYQSADVATFVSNLGSTNSGKFNASGRGFPDVSSQGHHFEIALDGEAHYVNGTSCATPSFASVIALINDKLLAKGSSPLGFLNPFLYSTGRSGFNDITSGNNPGCNSTGFSASTGWDPVTGLGTPNFDALLAAAGA